MAQQPTRINYWLALITTLLTAGFWKAYDHQADIATRVIRIEDKLDALDRAGTDREGRIRQLERAHP